MIDLGRLAQPMAGDGCRAELFSPVYREQLKAACAEDADIWAIYANNFGPDGFDTGHGNPGCVLEVEQGKKLTWTSALAPGYRPAEMGEGCESFPMTAVVTFEDAGNGKTAYRAVALHKDAKDKETHEKMGFHDGWGTVAGQLEEFAKSLKVSA